MRNFAILFATLSAFAFGYLGFKPEIATVEAQDAAKPDTQCIGEALAEYMNAVVNPVRLAGISKVKLLSPVFNITSPYEVEIFNYMRDNGAQFGKLDGFGGNTYRIVDSGLTSPYGYYVNNSWRDNFASFGKPTFFTEYGIFDNNLRVGGARPSISQMQSDYDEAKNDVNVHAIVYFNAMNNNTEFARHELTAEEFAQITQGDGKAGVNSAVFMNTSFSESVRAYSPSAHWTVEIIDGVSPLNARDVVKAANSRGIVPILRACVGANCAYADPQAYVTFITQLDSLLDSTNEVWVVVGPNEPATESWAAPHCKTSLPTRPFSLREVPCNEVQDPEFHSLRPYPISPCNPSPTEEITLMCGNDLIAKEVFEITPFHGVGGVLTKNDCPGNIEAYIDGQVTCNMSIDSSVTSTIDFSASYLPIMGNTEIVSNATQLVNPPSLPRLVNEYISWYLNGTTFRAEEEDEALNVATGADAPNKMARIAEIINFSGPLKKLLPFSIQNSVNPAGYRQEQKNNVSSSDPRVDRHDQIGVCTAGWSIYPVMCYNSGGSENHIRITGISSIAGHGLVTRLFPFIPMSSTEDRLGDVEVGREPFHPIPPGATSITFKEGSPRFKNSITKDPLYFAHMEEDAQLASHLQNTFVSKSQLSYDGSLPPAREFEDNYFCEVLESKTNPGDDLYGEWDPVTKTNTNQNMIEATADYTMDFTCDFGPMNEEQQEEWRECTGFGGNWTDCAKSAGLVCERHSLVNYNLYVHTPKVGEIYSRLVYGSQSIFKRIFPKIGPDTPVEEIKEIPGKSPVRYSSVSNNQGDQIFQYSETLAGDPNKNRSGTSAELFFPHIGSMHEYFLQGIQKALRPKGFESLTAGETRPEDAICSIEGSQIQSQALLNIIAAAARWANVPVEVLVTVVRGEGCGGGDRIGGICQYSDELVEQYSQPGAEDPRNCPTGGYNQDGKNKGPLQFFHDPVVWGTWADAINLARSERRETNPCNIADSIYAAAWALSASNDGCANPGHNVSIPQVWDNDGSKRAISAWAIGCNMRRDGSAGYIPCTGNTPALEDVAQFYCSLYDRISGGITTDCN